MPRLTKSVRGTSVRNLFFRFSSIVVICVGEDTFWSSPSAKEKKHLSDN